MKVSEKHRRGKRRYWISLVIYTLLLLIAAVLALTVLWQYAEEYEASRPNKAMDAYVDKLNSELMDSGLSEAIAGMKHEAQTDEECAAVISEQLASGVTYMRKSGGTTEGDDVTITYALRCGGSTIGSVTLTEDTSKADESKFKLLPWVVCREDFDLSGFRSSVSVTIPETYTVKLNGFTLDSKYIVEKDIHYDVLEQYYEINPKLPKKVTYQYDDAIGTLEMKIYDDDGNEFTIDPTLDDSQFVKPVSADEAARLETFGRLFASNYMTFASGTYNGTYALGLISPYVKSGSDLDKRLRESLDGYTWSHTYQLRIDSITFNGATDLGEGCYVVDMTTQGTTLSTSYSGEKVTVNNMKIIATNFSGSFLAISVEMY